MPRPTSLLKAMTSSTSRPNSPDSTSPASGNPAGATLGGELSPAARVLAVVNAIPAGNATTYGEVAKVAGTGARYVGTVLARQGDAACWWRVVRADGTLPVELAQRARPHWEAEALAFSGRRLDLGSCGIDARELAAIMANSL